MEISFIGMPLKAGASRGGMEYGPREIRKANLEQLFRKHGFHDEGDIEVRNDEQNLSTPNMKNLRCILEADKKLADKVREAVHSGCFPLIFGGDHSLSWGSISGVKAEFEHIGVVYIDAHGDFNTAETSPTHNVHGMHMAYLMGLDENAELNNFYNEGVKVDKHDVYFVCSRSLDKGEQQFAKENNMNICTTADCLRLGAEQIAAQTIARIKESAIEHVHISLDIDCMDPQDVPGTGVPEKNGVHPDFVYLFLALLLRNLPVCSMDIVELNPEMDVDGKSLEVCKRLLEILDRNLN